MNALHGTRTCSRPLIRSKLSAQQSGAHVIRRSFHPPPKSQSKTIFSGIQPTGVPHLGNYLGALRQWKRLQDTSSQDDTLFFSLVDLHAITIQQPPQQLRQWKKESLAMLLAVGLSPSRSTIFHQSDVPAHAELMWILSCLTSTGKLSRMTQWKDKTSNNTNEEKVKLGLFSYPVLQAADVLLYKTTHVPVGEDQAQHLELARNLAGVFNHNAGKQVLIQPSTWISPAKRIMNLVNPASKMSKSAADPNSRIMLTDADEDVRMKIRKAKTDSMEGVEYLPGERPGVANLIDILHACRGGDAGGTTEAQVVEEKKGIAEGFKGSSMKVVKQEVADAVVKVITPIRESYLRYITRSEQLDEVAREGAAKARATAESTLREVKEAVGLV